MDDFITTYLLLLLFGLIVFVLFWGTVIYLVVKFLRGDTGMAQQQKLTLLARLMQLWSGRGGPSEPGPIESEVGDMASREGIDLHK
jgi:hypothetical protein